MRGRIAIGLLVTLFANIVLAHVEFGPKSNPPAKQNLVCQKIWPNKVEQGNRQVNFIPSGRDADVMPKYMAYLDELMRPGGILEQLGLNIVPQTYLFTPGNLVAVLAAMNMFPVGHWHDGAKVTQAASNRGGILELVYPGGSHRTAIFRDDIEPMRQISIINHVIGHVFFGMNNKFSQTRTADAVAESVALYNLMENLYMTENHDEVADWYHFLKAMEWDQDAAHAVHESPEHFQQWIEKSKLGKTKNGLKIPQTRNVLQYIVATLPSDIVPWKREMAVRMERLARYIPGAINTKYMNEGVAVLFQELLPQHSSLAGDFAHHMDFCCLLQGVATRRGGHVMNDLSNPYFVGWEGWREARREYHQRPELAGKTLIQKDAAFLKWLAQEQIQEKSDSDYLGTMFTDNWIRKENLRLSRQADQNELEQQPPGPPPPHYQKPAPHVVTSRDPEDIRQFLVDMKEQGNVMIPTPSTIQSYEDPTGVIELQLVYGIGKYQPLKTAEMVSKLWMMSKVAHRPIALETTFAELTQQNHRNDQFWGVPWWQPPQPKFEFYRIRTMVSPDGRVDVKAVYRDGKTGPKSVPDPETALFEKPMPREFRAAPRLEAESQGFLNAYLMDLYIDSDPEQLLHQFPGLAKDIELLPKVGSMVETGGVTGGLTSGFSSEIFNHAPTMPRAILEFQKKLGQRLSLAIHQAIHGRARVRMRNGRTQVRALPSTPSFQYNTTFDGEKMSEAQGIIEQVPQSPVDAIRTAPVKRPLNVRGPLVGSALKTAVEAPEIGRGNGQPGDPTWGEGKNDNGSGGRGKPDEHGEPEEGEEGDDPAKGPKPGEGGNDPSYVDIPDDILAQALGESIELPNLRKLEGESDRRTTVIGRHKQQKAGIPRQDLILKRAFALGVSSLYGDGHKSLSDMVDATLKDPQNVMQRGISRLRTQDFFVKGEIQKIDPDVNVVVYVILDMSGSMSMWINTIKRMSNDLKLLLSNRYKRVELRFVPFDGRALVLENLDELLKLNLGGGTKYGLAFDATHKHMDANFPYGEWDRIVTIFGDLQDAPRGNDLELYNNMALRSQYVGVIETKLGWDWESEYSKFFKGRFAEDEFFGYLALNTPADYAPIVFRTLFRNDEEK